jgi:hypothetical protein
MKKRLSLALAVLTGIFLISVSIVWAQPAPVARTGQTKCYLDNGTEMSSCSGTFRDGDYQMGVPWPDPRFTDNGDGTVTDNLTGLMWAKDANLDNGTMIWVDAIDYANNLSLGTECGTPRTDWRLPNIKELLSLIDYGNYNVVLPSNHPFSNVQDGYYWSSTTAVKSWVENKAFRVTLVDGRVYRVAKGNGNWVWPVRGETIGSPAPVPKTGQTKCYVGYFEVTCAGTGQDGEYQNGVAWPSPRFKDHQDGTVTDRLTGLMWASDANIWGAVYWPHAIVDIHNLSLGSDGCGGPAWGDWRMPNIKEQLSLIDYGNYGPVLISGHPFSDVDLGSYWYFTSTDYKVGNSINPVKMKVGMGDGYVGMAGLSPPNATSVWPVRGGN